MKYSDDGKKLIIDEKGPVKKNAKSLADKSTISQFFSSINMTSFHNIR